MLKRRADAATSAASGPEPPTPETSGLPPLSSSPPTLGDLDYRVQGLLPTDSKMSEILVATDRKAQKVIFKIACVQQRARADTNRRAIRNSVEWLLQLGSHSGIAQLQPIVRKGASGPQAWFTPPCFIATLPDWAGNPDFLITEYLPGGTLSNFVGKRPLPVDLALGLAHDLAQTLAYLHARQCVHRDLKPENVLFRVTPTRTAKAGELQPVLIDFGIAARIGEPKLISGSRLWMAPELQDAYEKTLVPVDPTWDVYALGLICCYMLSGVRPRRKQYDAQDYAEYQEQVFAQLAQEAAGADAAWQQLTQALRQVLEQTLASDPHKRPTAAEFADEIGKLLTRMGIELGSHTPRQHFIAQRLRSVPMAWRFAGLVLVTITSLLLLLIVLQVRLPIGVAANQQPAVVDATAASLPDSGVLSAPMTIALKQIEVLPPLTETTTPSAMQIPTLAALPPISQEQRMAGLTTTITVPALTVPPPTLAAQPAPATQTKVIPTLATLPAAVLVAPPTLVQATPTMTPTVVPPTSTATRPPPTATATRSVSPTATSQRISPALAAIKLIAPQPGVAAAQERVEFVWETTGTALAPDQCYELVFWDPAKERDKRSPIGASQSPSGMVNFNKLRESPDSLLRTLARSPQGFAWGVRLVSCTSPETVLQNVSEVRHYTYQP